MSARSTTEDAPGLAFDLPSKQSLGPLPSLFDPLTDKQQHLDPKLIVEFSITF